jgi:hypothetical protein
MRHDAGTASRRRGNPSGSVQMPAFFCIVDALPTRKRQ